MMKLLWSPRSPFVRKVMIVAHELCLVDQLELVRAVAVARGEPNPVILSENPLGKIPTLIVPDMPPVFDSDVICDWLSMLLPEGETIVPRSGRARLTQLRWQALGDGLAENLLLWRSACLAEAGADPETVRSYRAKIQACLRVLEGEADQLDAEPFGIGQIAILCALGQLDFRFAHSDWRGAHLRLAAWEAKQALRPSVIANAIVNDDSGEGPHMDLSFRKD